jgi:predicted transcriptional regulator
MLLRKTTIAIPDDLLLAVDGAARARGESRSQFVRRVLQEAVRARRDAEVTRRLNRLFADPELAREQAREAAELDAIGTDWSEDVGVWMG